MTIQSHRIPSPGFSLATFMQVSALALVLGFFQALELDAFSSPNSIEGPFCIAFGIGLSILLLFGLRYWPFVLAGILLGELYAEHDVLRSLLIAGGYTACLMLGVRLLLFFKFNRSLDSLRDLLLLTGAAFITALISAAVHILSLYIVGITYAEAERIFANLFIGDLLGILFVTPAILIFYTPFSSSILRRKVWPFIAYCFFSFLLAQAIFFNWFPGWMGWAEGRGALIYLVLLIAGVYFGRHGVLILFLGFLFQALFSGVYGDAFVTTEYMTLPRSVSIWQFMGFALFFGMSSTIVFQQLKRKNAELLVASKSLQDSAALFRDLVEKIPVLMAIYDPKTDTTEYVNSHFTQVLGYSNLDFQRPGSWWLAAYPELHYRTEVIAQWHEFTAGVSETKSTGRSLETWVQCKDGSKKRLSWGMFLVDQKMAVYALDITKRQQTEQLLMTTSAVYRAIGEAVIITDSKNKIVLVNDNFEKLTSFAGKEIVGTNFMDLLVKRHGARSYSDIISSLQAAGHWEGQAWIKSRSGEETLQFVSIYSTFDEEGAIDQRVVLISELTDQRKARALINQQANFDPLTDLPNRRLMSDRLEQLIKLASRANQHIAVIYLDLDNFKEVNDSRGHDFGDALLRVIAARLRAEVRESDTVARIGGDEFVVLLGGLERPEHADVIVQQVLKNLSKPIEIDEHLTQITASFGIALFPADGGDSKALILAADQAMYAAKAQGRNSHYYFTQALQVQASYRSRMISELRVAMQEKQFELFFQPIVEIKTGAIAHAEVLLRWRKKSGELVTPSVFIDIAEDSGMLVDIGDWVMQEAIHFIRDLPRNQTLSLAVNVSASQFNSDRHSAINWINWINEAGISPASIVIEVTERLILLDSQRVQRKIKTLQESGCLFSVDDFGTGYSSLASLRNFDFDFIKIDRQFIHALSSMGEDEPLVSAMIAMAKGLKLQPIAEGVETKEQKAALIQMGCLYAQGYLFHKPMPAAEFKDLLSNYYK